MSFVFILFEIEKESGLSELKNILSNLHNTLDTE